MMGIFYPCVEQIQVTLRGTLLCLDEFACSDATSAAAADLIMAINCRNLYWVNIGSSLLCVCSVFYLWFVCLFG